MACCHGTCFRNWFVVQEWCCEDARLFARFKSLCDKSKRSSSHLACCSCCKERSSPQNEAHSPPIPSLSIISLFLYITSLCILHPIFLYYFSNFGHFLSLHFASLCVISLYFASPVSVFSLSVYLTRWAGRGVNDLGVEEEEDG